MRFDIGEGPLRDFKNRYRLRWRETVRDPSIRSRCSLRQDDRWVARCAVVLFTPVIGRRAAKMTIAITHAVGAAISGIAPPPAIHHGIAARFMIIFGHIFAPSTKPQCRPIEKYTLPVSMYASPRTRPSRNRPTSVGIAIAGLVN